MPKRKAAKKKAKKKATKKRAAKKKAVRKKATKKKAIGRKAKKKTVTKRRATKKKPARKKAKRKRRSTSGGGSSAETSATSVITSFVEEVFVACANGGVGEVVRISGELHLVLQNTQTDGKFHLVLHAQPQGVTGIGLTTGDTYHATGVTQQTYNFDFDGLPFNTTLIYNFRLIGTGDAVNFHVHVSSHFSINANGQTATHHFESITCQEN